MSIYTKESLRTFFQSTFNLEEWYSFLQNFFIASELKSTPEEINTNNNDKGFYLGNIQTEDSYRIGLFHYKINNGSVANKRVGLRNLVKTFINPNWGEFDAALVVFNSDDNWRFSFICDIKEESTAAKRYTYVFGNKDLLYRTPIERFIQLQKKGISFENIKTAFSVEALSNEFFDKYREQYADFIQYITGKRFVKVNGKWVEKVLSKPNDDLMNAFNNDEKLIRDYIKKMMGRITFLHFLQRKGWMNGDLNYMQNMFENSPYKENYLDSVLEPLFFGILNTKPEERKDLFFSLSWDESLLEEWKDIPYLNGGLFEWDIEDYPITIFPSKLFKDLFDFFSEYNFTIDENDPNDAEIGVDPEMLGKIFENLLEDNKDKGAFYTPKEIVQYMCQESLIAYLETNTSLAKDKIRNFVLLPEEGVLDIPDNKKQKLQTALEEVKICDPAIGSGAFPMGLLNELLHCREVLSCEYYDRAEIKKSIIKNNIYGVDIEKGAVDIARLRFWLSIVVDENTPTPLPNLDYKIMQGNSLIESYQGVDLSNLTYEKKTKMDGFVYSMFDDEKDIYQKEVSNLLSNYYSCSDHKEKDTLQRKISNVIHKLIKSQGYESILSELQEMNLAENNKFFLWHTWFSDVFNREEGKNGFDIVIGNPPYIFSRNNLTSKDKRIYKENYFLTQFKINLYILFIEKGFHILKENGTLFYITPNNWLTLDTNSDLREFILKETYSIKILQNYANVFENAKVDTVIIGFNKIGSTTLEYLEWIDKKPKVLSNKNKSEYLKIPKFIISNSISSFMDKIKGEELEYIADVKNGVQAYTVGEGIPICTKEIKENREYHSFSKNGHEWFKYLDGADVQRYNIGWSGQYIKYGRNLSRPRKFELFNGERILVRQIPNKLPYCINASFTNELTINDNNSMIIKLFDPYFKIKYVLAILNSKLISKWFSMYFGKLSRKIFPQFKVRELRLFPIAKSSDIVQLKFEKIVDQIYINKKNNINTDILENEIDKMVYKLYDLTYDEVLDIDPATPITREEYELVID